MNNDVTLDTLTTKLDKYAWWQLTRRRQKTSRVYELTLGIKLEADAKPLYVKGVSPNIELAVAEAEQAALELQHIS